ncbi:hypothetical protein [Salinisphaera japonica]|uniref:Uncharacterized protein n=1 Tax=Salinisphaera japonica YTM-1 TaxID=1209778 RepID=A0A423PFW7_9GAMM|nr:hypothetical protein [Salinisphaera japonica]ROO24396.1 hypothetical protein SAJA_13965 [Salinisphaera japonica YTM-1]
MSSIDASNIPADHVDIGGAAVPRVELAKVLPDIVRFEANLTDALAVESHMKQGDGVVPDFVTQWPEDRLAEVITTLKELGSIREQLMRADRPDDGAADTA